MTEKRRFLQYVDMETREVIHQVDVTGRSEREVENIEMGMIMRMRDGLFVNDTETDETGDPS